jgi:hypothetical protein
MDLTPLLRTLGRLSGDRILADASVEKDGEVHRATIPVVARVAGPERQEATLRAYASDWVTKNSVEPLRARCTYEDLKSPGAWKYDDGRDEARPVVAIIVLTWWPRPKEVESWSRTRAGAQHVRPERVPHGAPPSPPGDGASDNEA